MSKQPVILSNVPELKSITFRWMVLRLFHCNVNRHNNGSVKDGANVVKYFLKYLPAPADLRDRLSAACAEAFADVNRWWDKHGELFQDRKARRTQHLRLCFDTLVWKSQIQDSTDDESSTSPLLIDDLASAKAIIAENSDWPQLQFQFACAYALEATIRGFDKIRMRAFRKKLNDHPLYDFWFHYLMDGGDSSVPGLNLFDTMGIAPHQYASLAFQWALAYGYLELTQYFWRKTSPAQREYVGVLEWRRVCKNGQHRDVFTFLCKELCQNNYVNILRITTPIILYSIMKAVDDSQTVACREQNFERTRFLFEFSCERLRRGLFELQNYRPLLLSLQRRNARMIKILQQSVSPQQMTLAFERVGIDFPRLIPNNSGSISSMAGSSRMPPRQWSTG